MYRIFLKSKIHKAIVTGAELNYEGSLTIDATLMRAAEIRPYEMVRVYNMHNGERFETYAIEGEPDSGVICLNGAAARKGLTGDVIIIACYTMLSDDEIEGFRPVLIHVDERNRIKEKK